MCGDFDRRRLQEPGYGTSELTEKSEMAEDAVTWNAGSGEVDDNWVRIRKRARASIEGWDTGIEGVGQLLREGDKESDRVEMARDKKEDDQKARESEDPYTSGTEEIDFHERHFETEETAPRRTPSIS